MRVLVLSQYFWPENFQVNQVVRLLFSKGVEVEVLTGQPNYPRGSLFEGYRAWGCEDSNYEGVTVRRIPLLPRGRGALRLVLNYLSFVISGLLIAPWRVRQCKFDVIFVFAPSPILQAIPALWLGRIKKAPVAIWVQDLWPESLSATGYVSNPAILKLVEMVVRWTYRASDRILVQSHAFIAPVAVLTDDPRKIYYYPNWYLAGASSLSVQRTGELVKTLKTHFSVVFAGNLGAVQALDTIVEVAGYLLPYPDIRIVLVGSGSLDGWLAQERDNQGLTNLILAGRFEATDMPSIFDAAEALLVSLKPEPIFSLTVPSKVQAYLAAGRPILAALDGEGAEIVREAGAGLCSAAGNGRALAENVLRLKALSPNERQQMGLNGRRYFEKHFAPDALVDELVQHFKDLVARKEKRG